MSTSRQSACKSRLPHPFAYQTFALIIGFKWGWIAPTAAASVPLRGGSRCSVALAHDYALRGKKVWGRASVKSLQWSVAPHHFTQITKQQKKKEQLLTSLLSYQGVVMMQVFHLLCVVLSISRVCSGVSRLCPPDLGDSSCGYVQALDPHIPSDLHNNPPRHQVSSGEHRQVVLIQTVKVDRQGPHFAQYHDDNEWTSKQDEEKCLWRTSCE